MPRRKPFSAKKRKGQLQDKRAVKRGDEPTHAPTLSARLEKGSNRPQRSLAGAGTSTKLASRFIALTPEYLETTRNLSYSTLLTRPIPGDHAVFPVDTLARDEGRLKCPGRPKFKYGQTKKEVERNEEGWFKKWLKDTEAAVREWVEGEDEGEWPRSPSWFETNLEVWRQLWRVTESSSILLVLLDSRCPALHCPPSLRTYVQGLKTRKEVVLVLTKADLVDPAALAGWKAWVKDWWGEEVEVVSVMSYDLAYLEESGRHRPEIPLQSLEELIGALKRAHGRLSIPPEKVREDPEHLAKWTSPVRGHVDWSAMLGRPSDDADSITAQKPGISTPKTDASVEQEDPLTIGLIGQPNVGKSSLLNALLGESRVRASKTPGKTKHFQTMFWGDKKEIKMVDCPGLVCPSLVGLEVQALAGILPISQIPSLPACMHYAAKILPLEEIFRIPAPEVEAEDQYQSKKTWREPKETSANEAKVKWSAGLIMEQRALNRGYLTAKGGRPDGNRAANGIMRSLADGRVRWGFWSPGADASLRTGKGIWLDECGDTTLGEDVQSEAGSAEHHTDIDRALESGDSISAAEDSEDEHSTSVEEDEDSERDDVVGGRQVGGFFSALDIEDDDEDDEEAEEDDEVVAEKSPRI